MAQGSHDTEERNGAEELDAAAEPHGAPHVTAESQGADDAAAESQGAEVPGPSAEAQGTQGLRPLWVEEPARRRRLPDPVRTAAVRAVLIIAVTLIQATVAFLSTLAGSWLAFPTVLSGVLSTVVATWAVLDVWVTHQVWRQRHGVVSVPSSTTRSLRRERRRERRQERRQERRRQKGTAERHGERIRRTGHVSPSRPRSA